MDETEKLTALKNAYVDVILNTAKEAAARIIVSEKKAIRFQRELSTTKDEALRMLLGLKGMLDSKAKEAELASLNQQRKIEELEAQLGEAEDIVRDLRLELQEVQDELERLTRKRVQSVETNIATPEEITQENRVSKLDSTPNGAYSGNECDSKNDFRMGYNQAHNPDLATIGMRSKEPEIYTNGCTQRICEFEENLLDVKVHLSREAGNTKKGIFIWGDEETENIFGEEEDSNMLKVTKEEDSSDFEESITKSFCRKRNGQARNNKRKAPSESDLYCCELFSVDNNNQSGNHSFKIDEKDVQNCPEFSPAQNIPLAGTENDTTFIKACSSWKTANDNKVVLEKSDLTSQENFSLENLEVQTGKRYAAAVNEAFVHSDMKDSDFNDEVPSPPPSTRFLRYTFQRKRKRDPLSSPDGNSSLDDSSLERKMGKKENSPVVSEKSSLITESSQEIRRIAEVACQLISLSEKNR